MPKVFKGIFGGGKQKAPSAAPAGGDKKLFTPEQIQQATKDYSSQGLSKWNQILSNMGAGGGTGGQDITQAISDQATSLGNKLGELTQASGYGSEGMGQLPQIMKALEGQIGAKYSVY